MGNPARVTRMLPRGFGLTFQQQLKRVPLIYRVGSSCKTNEITGLSILSEEL
ncbi:hypothetical protein WUBG_11565 [Wuchereria bancrofti]|uniref:Uncharacterized protein n=1 Tax=Wuchereria bancrofti TaxID=6293 RepID=J9EKK3_WUCBA|nr:hypothetical protein WUBG_11565 [Wuchereria bancrofti]